MKKNLNRTATLILIGIMSTMVAFTACGKNEKDNTDTVSSSDSVSAADTVSENDVTADADVSEDSEASFVLRNCPVEEYVTLGEYTGLSIEVGEPEIDEAQVEDMVKRAYSSCLEESDGVKDRAVEDGDIANINYVGKMDDVEFDGGSADNYNLEIGSGTFIPGFEEQLIGQMPGETKDITVTFPEEYKSADLAGKDAVFTVTINYILPTDMKDEVVQRLGIDEVSTVDELYDYARNYAKTSADSDRENEIQNSILKLVINGSEIKEIPQDMYDYYSLETRKNFTSYAEANGADVEVASQTLYGMGFEEFLEQYTKEATERDLIIQAIANKEGLNCTEADIEVAGFNAGYDDVETFKAENGGDYIYDSITYSKVMDFLKENTEIN